MQAACLDSIAGDVAPFVQPSAGGGDATSGALIPLDTLAADINARLEKAEACARKQKGHRLAAGLQLIAARKRVEAGEAGEIGWHDWVRANIKRTLRDVQKVMAVARAPDPEKKLAEERDRVREQVRRHREDAIRMAPSPVPEPLAAIKAMWLELSAAEQSAFLAWVTPVPEPVEAEPTLAPEPHYPAPEGGGNPLYEIYDGLKPNTRTYARCWVEDGCPIASNPREHFKITEALQAFRAAARKASEEERRRFLEMVAVAQAA
jgi:hypothetical protein